MQRRHDLSARRRRGYRPIGFDLDPELVEVARQKHPDLEFRAGSIIDSKGIRRSLTICLEVIEHIPPAVQKSFITELAETVPRDGLLILSTPGRHSMLSYLERARQRRWKSYNWWDPSHVGVMYWRRLRGLLEPVFQIESHTGFCYLPAGRFTPSAASRWPLWVAGFDLIVTARRASLVRERAAPDHREQRRDREEYLAMARR